MADQQRTRRIILFGAVGAGKSATGNTILMRKRFQVSDDSQAPCTKECSISNRVNKETQVSYHVLDTLGIADDQGIRPEAGHVIHQEIVRYCNDPHVFLLMVDPDSCSHVMAMVTALKTWLGAGALDHTIVVFTKGTSFKTDACFQSFIHENKLSELENVFGRRIARIENHGEGRYKSQRNLLCLIENACLNGRAIFRVTPKPRHAFGLMPKARQSLKKSTDITHGKVYEVEDADSKNAPQLDQTRDDEDELARETKHASQIVPVARRDVVERYHRNGAREETPDTPKRQHLQRADVQRTVECAVNAGRALRHFKDSPVTSIAQMALLAMDEDNIKAVKNVVESEEVQNAWAVFKSAVGGIGEVLSEVAQEVEKNRRQQQIEAMNRNSDFRY